ncbi:hypothetical protein Dimus_038090 [Dionaea muscipula]
MDIPPAPEEPEGDLSQHATPGERHTESVISDQTCEALTLASGHQSFRCRVPQSFELPYYRRSGNLKGFALFQHSFEYGLCLPLCIFYQDICDILGASPAQFVPNAWGTICTFNIECHRMGRNPMVRVFFFFQHHPNIYRKRFCDHLHPRP